MYNKKEQTVIRKELRNEKIKAEAIFWKYVKEKKIGFKFRRQYGIGKYIVDFCCPSLKLIVEIDGSSHDGEDALEVDMVRQKYLESIGFFVRRYKNEQLFYGIFEVVLDIKRCCEQIKNNLPLPPP